MTLGWSCQNIVQDCLPCMATTSKMWLHRLGRELWGGEALSIQGLWWKGLQVLISDGTLDHRRLQDLAGNAFSGFCVAALISAAVACMGCTRGRSAADYNDFESLSAREEVDGDDIDSFDVDDGDESDESS